MRSMALLVGVVLGCATRDPDGSGEGSGDGSGEEGADDGSTAGDDATGDGDGTMSGSGGGTTGDPGECDPSDPEIGPTVAVTILNQTDAPLYFSEAESCAFGSPFEIALGRTPIAWIFGICESCADALEGLCFCPAACAQDTVVRVDPGGRYEGMWPGSVIFDATLTPECVDEQCGPQCRASAQAEPGDYTASAVASPMVACDVDPCDCTAAPDPDGWCSITGTRAGGDLMIEMPFAYPDETAVELLFE